MKHYAGMAMRACVALCAATALHAQAGPSAGGGPSGDDGGAQHAGTDGARQEASGDRSGEVVPADVPPRGESAADAVGTPAATGDSAAASGAGEPRTGRTAGLVEWLGQRMKGNDAPAVLRSVSNGPYAARLMMDEASGVWYAALLQDGQLWRVIETPDEVRANAVFDLFASQTADLSRDEMARAQLASENAALAHRLALAKQRLDRLRADAEVAREQASQWAGRDAQARADLARLRGEQDDARARLLQTQRQVEALRQELGRDLPPAHLPQRRAPPRARQRVAHPPS